MECEEDTKRKDEKERIEHCQKEIKRWKRYAIVSIAISAILLAACIGGSIYVRYFIIEEKSIQKRIIIQGMEGSEKSRTDRVFI